MTEIGFFTKDEIKHTNFEYHEEFVLKSDYDAKVKELEDERDELKRDIQALRPSVTLEQVLSDQFDALKAQNEKMIEALKYVADYKQPPLDGEAERFHLVDSLNLRIRLARQVLKELGE